MEIPPRKKESQNLQRPFCCQKKWVFNTQKEELISSLLIQALFKGHWIPGILNKTPNLSAKIFKDHNFCLCGETAQRFGSLFFSFFSFTFHDASNQLKDGYKNELKNLSKASFLKNIRRDRKVTLVWFVTGRGLWEKPFLLFCFWLSITQCAYTH